MILVRVYSWMTEVTLKALALPTSEIETRPKLKLIISFQQQAHKIKLLVSFLKCYVIRSILKTIDFGFCLYEQTSVVGNANMADKMAVKF